MSIQSEINRINNDVDTQTDLIASIKSALEEKAAGGSSNNPILEWNNILSYSDQGSGMVDPGNTRYSIPIELDRPFLLFVKINNYNSMRMSFFFNSSTSTDIEIYNWIDIGGPNMPSNIFNLGRITTSGYVHLSLNTMQYTITSAEAAIIYLD